MVLGWENIICLNIYLFVFDLFLDFESATSKPSKQGALLAGDTGYMLTSTSSDPAIEAALARPVG